jgi:hypothetical protein
MDHIVALGFFFCLEAIANLLVHFYSYITTQTKNLNPVAPKYVRNFLFSKFARENHISLYHMLFQIQTMSFYMY